MRSERVIDVLAAGHGVFPAVARLNPMLSPQAPLFKLTVRVDWHPGNPATALLWLERQLAGLVPGLARHQCRGPHQYRLFQPPPPDHAAGVKHARQAAPAPLEAGLALVHLAEHVMIDAVAFVTDATRVSGLTGARSDDDATFDVFVECPVPAVARLASHLALAWVQMLLDGAVLDGGPRRTLEIARSVYRRRPELVTQEALARETGWPADEIEAAFGLMQSAGFVRQEFSAMNMSGVQQFRFAANGAVQ